MIVGVSLLMLLASSTVIDAAPVKIKREDGGLLHLPIVAVRSLDGTEDAETHLRGHITRSQRRLARMIGRPESSANSESLDRLQRRLHSQTAHDTSSLQKKGFNRRGAVSPKSRLRREDDQEDDAILKAVKVNSKAASKNSIAAATNPTAKNSIGLSIEANDAGYIATVQVGTPPRDFKVLVDSGSADFWVTGEDCKSSSGDSCGKSDTIGPQTSSTFLDTRVSYTVSYGSGNLTGNIVSDNVKVGDLSIPQHTFGNALVQSPEMLKAGGTFDGIMGLGQSFLSSQKHLTIIDTLAKIGQVSEPIVSYFIPRLADNKNNGQVTFGGMDSTKFDPATMVTVSNKSPKGFWESTLDGVAIDGNDLGFTNRTGILDTGTSLILAPADDAKKIHDAIPGSQQVSSGFTIPCNTKSVVSLKFGGRVFTIDPRDLVQLPLDSTGAQCTSGIAAASDEGTTQYLVGDVFLKNVYFSTNSNTNKMSLAKLL